MKKAITIKNLRAYYILQNSGNKKIVRAVDDVSLDIYEGEILGIAGESGCGKTTLLKVLYGLLNLPLFVKSGEIIYHDVGGTEVDILKLPVSEKRSMLYWKHISYIPQASMNVLNPLLKVKKQFLKVLKTHYKDRKKGQLLEMAAEHAKNLGLPSDILDSYPHQLSGGMRQRVTIAIATLFTPKIIFADEPTTALDVVVQRGVMQILKDLQSIYKNTIVLVSHDIAVHAEITDRLGIMYAGKLVELGPTLSLFRSPLHPYTKFLIESLPQIGEKKTKMSVPGVPPSLINLPSGCRFHPRCPFKSEICSEEEPPFVEVREGHFVACFRTTKEEDYL